MAAVRRVVLGIRRSRVGFEIILHQRERLIVFLLCIRNSAITRDNQFVVAHVGIVRGEEDAVISGDAGEDERSRAEIAQQRFECGRKEARNALA